MAEITAAEAIAWLTEDKAFGQECYSRKQIAALIEQQAQEIAKKDRMIEKAIDMLENNCCDAAESFDCEETNRECRACWLAWLEKAALEEKP